MRVEIPFIEEKFIVYNSACFGNSLPQVAITVSKARSFVGQLRYRRKQAFLGRQTISGLTIAISNRYDFTPAEIEDILLHEMIHLYILVNKIKDTSSHGRAFRAMMKDINTRFNRHITISHRATPDMHDQDTLSARHLICVSTLTNGRLGITIAMPSALQRLWHDLPQLNEVVNVKWYLSTDPYFNRFRRSRTVKIYAADPAALQEHLVDARPLVKHGDRIFVSRENL